MKLHSETPNTSATDPTRPMKKRRRRWPWLIVLVPFMILILSIGGATLRYGWATVSQAGILGYTLLFPYTPTNANNTLVGPWTSLPEPGQGIGQLRIVSLGIQLPIVQGTYRDQVKDIGHFAGSTLPGQGGDAVLITENRKLQRIKVITPGTEVQWIAPQGVFTYRVTDSHPIKSLSDLSNMTTESLTLVEQSVLSSGVKTLYAVFAKPQFHTR